MLKRPAIKYHSEKDIDCYLVSGGVWGSYYPSTNKIHICPRKASPEFLEELVKHEITHLKHEHEVQGMTHVEKEKYISQIQKEQK